MCRRLETFKDGPHRDEWLLPCIRLLRLLPMIVVKVGNGGVDFNSPLLWKHYADTTFCMSGKFAVEMHQWRSSMFILCTDAYFSSSLRRTPPGGDKHSRSEQYRDDSLGSCQATMESYRMTLLNININLKSCTDRAFEQAEYSS